MNGVMYPPVATEPFRGHEAGQADAYQIVLGGFGIDLRFEVPGFSDQVRVITRCQQGD
jgi:hypothetical protein